jgi:pyruvate formate lyase activating enzyme
VSINKENNLLNKQVVYDLTPFTHLDYPDHLACIVWIAGCGLRCNYCYNKDIVFAKNGKLTFLDILAFLKTRVGLLDAIVLSGGEATNVDLLEFCTRVKALGFKIKLDTSGVNFEQIKNLVDQNLIDYIALDYKAPYYKYNNITQGSNIKFNNFEQTLNYLIKVSFDFEVRTTVHRDYLNEDDINFIIDQLNLAGYSRTYYLQNFLETDDNIADIKRSMKIFNIDKVHNELIDIEYRNF